LSDDPHPADLRTMTRLANRSMSAAERFQHDLHPVTSFAIIPLFALANAGVRVEASAFDAPGATSVALGVVLGLVVGKTVGITAATWLAVRSGLGSLPQDTTWAHLVGAAAVAGIGFTVSLFITDLAFAGTPLQDGSKVGIVVASVLASAIGTAVLAVAGRRRRVGDGP
ncbi:MAG: Na+/H+ antiporter NhaA, partial [Actinomycetota bacterium]|nr:Na+/H+ antiporter NhaA [Actinomycetota bacterium]